MPLSIGQSSGDYLETQRRIQPLYISGIRITGQPYSPDAFTQSNPPNVLTHVSTTLTGVRTRGVLGGTVAYIRPDVGNGPVGGPPAAYNTRVRALGLFIADARGVPFENTPGIASGEASYYADGGTFANSLWETFNLSSGAALVYEAGDELYSSKNGLITNVAADNNTYEQGLARSLVGLVKIAPDAHNSLMVFCLRI
jgi:hypothetical protein